MTLRRIEGYAEGDVVRLDVPISFWGGFDAHSGKVIEPSHPAYGQTLSDRILVMPSGRGSSSASSVLAEAIRLGTAPAAIVLAEPDPILTVGAIVAQRLYGKSIPVVVCDPAEFAAAANAGRLRIIALPSEPPRVELVPCP